jgi:type I site-specific restriction-modification system R (restriction) subunit
MRRDFDYRGPGPVICGERFPGTIPLLLWIALSLAGVGKSSVAQAGVLSALKSVVNHIVTHFQTKVEPNGFKAQVVTFDRECCVLYKAVMDELLGPEASAIVMTSAQGDLPEWKQHVRDKDAEEKLLDRFRDPADPLKFVIVTSKLLTGFDAPILQVMYLDKPMKDHNLDFDVGQTRLATP